MMILIHKINKFYTYKQENKKNRNNNWIIIAVCIYKSKKTRIIINSFKIKKNYKKSL